MLQLTLAQSALAAGMVLPAPANAPLQLPPEADISVVMTDSPDPVAPDGHLMYSFEVTNAGPDSASNVVLTADIPSGTTWVRFSVANFGPIFACGAPRVPMQKFRCVTATFAAGAVARLTLVVHVDPALPACSVITNTLTVSTATTDPNPGNESATVTTEVECPADLSAIQSDSPDPVRAGDNLTYTLTVSNAGPGDAQNVTVSDAVPASTTFVSLTQASGSAFTLTTPPAAGTDTVTATIATLPSGASATFTLVVNVNVDTPDGTLISNTLTVSSETSDPSTTNNSATETTQVTGPGT